MLRDRRVTTMLSRFLSLLHFDTRAMRAMPHHAAALFMPPLLMPISLLIFSDAFSLYFSSDFLLSLHADAPFLLLRYFAFFFADFLLFRHLIAAFDYFDISARSDMLMRATFIIADLPRVYVAALRDARYARKVYASARVAYAQ